VWACQSRLLVGPRAHPPTARQPPGPVPAASVRAPTPVVTPADEQAALRHIATLVAEGVAEDAVFTAVTGSIARIVGADVTALTRFERDDTLTLLAAWGADCPPFPLGDRRPLNAELRAVRDRGRACRFDGLPDATPFIEEAEELGLRWTVCVPIVVSGRAWGACFVAARARRFAPGSEERIGAFTELITTALVNAQARTEQQRLVREQASLRRVAELAAGGASLDAVLALVASEACDLFDATFTGLCRVDPDGDLTVVGLHNAPDELRLGQRESASAHGLLQEAMRVGHPVRLVGLDALPADWAACARRLGITSGSAASLLVDGRIWGGLAAMTVEPAPRGSQYRLGRFAELVGTAIGGAHARDELRALADQQAALRRVAELAASGAPTGTLVQAVVDQARDLLRADVVALLTYADDDSSQVIATSGAPEGMGVGQMGSGDGRGIAPRVRRSGRPVRVDDYGGLPGHGPELMRQHGYGAGAGAPIVIEGEVWGALLALGRSGPLRAGIEEDLAQFARLVATALAGAEARAALQALADEHAALRRVAELVARGVGQDGLFATVANEASRLIDGEAASLVRIDADDAATVVASHGGPAPTGTRTPLVADAEDVVGQVLRTRQPARIDDFSWIEAEDAAAVGRGTGSTVAAPILVEGRVWGILSVSSADHGLPVTAEHRLTQFTELVAAAIANAESRAQLTASRDRVLATADETRRRIQRDLHDGAQQRLVQAVINLKLALDVLREGTAADAEAHVAESLQHAEQATTDLRDLVRGILPAPLTGGGLRVGVESLVADLRLPVAVAIDVPRLAPETETTAYFIIAEALTNVVKHSRATRAEVAAELDGDRLAITVADDGVGGVEPAAGSGLTGLLDRVAAADGTLQITSPAGGGTTVRAELPTAGIRDSARSWDGATQGP
jgi:signal transduction histidine kinase/uncharacterized protein YoaH (UPF0181 family)